MALTPFGMEAAGDRPGMEIPEPWGDRNPAHRGTRRTTISSRDGDRLAVGGNTQAINPLYDDGQSEAAIAMNTAGTVLVAGFNDGNGFSVSPFNVSGVVTSLDGGNSWTATGPLPTGGCALRGDPDVKYDPVGDRFFYSSVLQTPAHSMAVGIHRSDAQGNNWTGPYIIPFSDVGGITVSDKEMIAVNPSTGRLIAVWVSLPGTVSYIRTSYSDDGGTTWSTGQTIAQSARPVQAPQVRFVPGPDNDSSKAWVVYLEYDPNTGPGSLHWVRSDDGGATWGAPQLLRDEVPGPDQVLGLGRSHMIPAIDVDPGNQRVYVVNAVPDENGMTDIEFFASLDSASFSAPVLINSNPGADGAQFLPTVAVDPITHRIHVTWCDQPGGATGDLTELMRTYSDDFGATWSEPTPIFDRPFHASYGDNGGPNLGDYNECVARGGILHAVAAATVANPRFDDGQPSPAMGAVETYHARRQEGPPPFTAASNTAWPMGVGTAFATAADVDGDGHSDLVSADASGTVTVRLGNGAGGFGPPSSYPAGLQAYDVSVADMNHDTLPDLVAGDYLSGTIEVLLNYGGGVFASTGSYPSGAGTGSVAVGDVNGDGNLDVVASNFYAASVTVLLGDGNGFLGAATEYASANPNWVELGDFNGDGWPDLVTTAPFVGALSVRLNDGAGNFPGEASYPVGAWPNALAVGDVNGDGWADIACSNFAGGSVSVLIGDGSGSFTVRPPYPVEVHPGSVAIADLDADGFVDLAVSHDSNVHGLSVLRGYGTTFGPPQFLEIPSNRWNVVAADVNEDLRPDLVSANFDDGSASVLIGGVDLTDYREVALRLASVALSDPCSPPGTARLDVGEQGSLDFTLYHYVANPVCNPGPYTNVTATLSSPTPGVTLTDATQSFGTAGPLGSVTNGAPFHIQLDSGFVPGTDVDLVLDVTTDQGPARLHWRLPTGSPGAATTLLDEDFEGVPTPDLPAGWSNASYFGYTVWQTSDLLPGGGSGSRTAFHGEDLVAWDQLFSPAVAVPAPPPGVESWVNIEFDLQYSMLNVPTRTVEATDLCYLRLGDLTGGQWSVRTVDAGSFGGDFTTGSRAGYDHRTPPESGLPTPQHNGWSGGSQGMQHVHIRIPGTGVAGHTIRLEFDLIDPSIASDCQSAGLPGPCGVSIDNVVVEHVLATSSPCPVTGVSSVGPVAFGLRGLTPNPSRSGRLAVSFGLAGAGEARIEMFDPTGRMVRSMDLGRFGPGEHSIDLADRGPIAPGIYFVRLRQAGREAVSRAVVLR